MWWGGDSVATQLLRPCYNTTRTDSIFLIIVNVNLAGCPSVTTTSPTTTSFATDQKIQAEYVNILVYIIACTMLRTVIRLLTELLV